MKAMILAAGFGTRLGALTAHTPKCLLKAGGKSMLEHAIERLLAAGVSEIAVNLHYRAADVERFLQENPPPVPVMLSHEPVILGTGGGLAKLEGFFADSEDFLLYNADVYTDFDLRQIIEARRAADLIGALLVMEREEDSYLLFDQKSVRWRMKRDQVILAQQIQ